MNILTINAGSSSIKYKVFADKKLLLAGLIEGIGEASGNWNHHYKYKESRSQQFSSHEQAFSALATQLKEDLINHPVQGVGHRVVHGGNNLYEPTIITPEVLQEIKKLAQLAPLHNPVNALGIEYALKYFSNALHVAVFDSGFHHTMPEHIRRYAINTATADRYQIRRYGFHGINHEYVSIQAAKYLNKPLSQCNFISLHLGNGASACLVKKGKSADTSMGMTPLAGLVMGTRCGDIDPAIPVYLLEQGLKANEIDTLLNKNSGLKGIANDNDMRNVLALADNGGAQAKLAIAMYVCAIQKIIGAYLAQTTTLDGLIFTGGVGENSAIIRELVIAPLAHFGFTVDNSANNQRNNDVCWPVSKNNTPILVIRGDEESLIAEKVIEKLLC